MTILFDAATSYVVNVNVDILTDFNFVRIDIGMFRFVT